MVTAKALLEKYRRVNVEMVTSESVNNTKEEMLELNLEQMMEGKTRTGEDITPSYLDDPYFKSRESAQRYSDWKDEITPNPKRTPGTPNYYINGMYHGTIKITVNGDKIEFNSDFPGARDIERKSGEIIYGLNAEKREEYINASLRKELMSNLRRILKS
ncbi:MAG: hypothetical protein ACTHMC_01555 [Pseudobacter sp.]|uniref:hypothetical protein n=1 Tax=Pseudobacter sp. TaxID=2045420 RepID=UPI003F7D9149